MPNRFKGALHLHTDFSDGELSLEGLKERFQKEGFQFLMMSDHAEGMDVEKMERYVSRCRELSEEDFLIVPGLEFSYPSPFAPGSRVHLLGYGIDGFKRAEDPVEMIHLIHRLGGLAVLAHPYPAHYSDTARMAPFLDGIELWNTKYNGRFAPALWNYALLKKIRAGRPEVFGFYGTDFHWKAQYAGMAVWAEAERMAPDALLAALSKGAFHGEKEGMLLASDGALTPREEAHFRRREWLYRLWRRIVLGARNAFKALRAPVPSGLKAIVRKTL